MAVASNLGTGGSALDAQYGSSSSSNTNEPLLLAHNGTNYLYLPGVGANYAQVPDSNALDITGDIECVARVSLASWLPAANQPILAKDASSQRSYAFRVLTNGAMAIAWSSDGTTMNTLQSSAALSLAAGATVWLRWRFDVDNGAAGKTATFWWAADQATEPTTWTQLGTDNVSAGTTSIFAGTGVMQLGANTNALTDPMTGRLFRVILRNGIGGTTVLDANFTTGITSGGQTSFVESSANAATVSILRAASGRKAVAVVRPLWLFGTDDFFEIADNDLLDFANGDDWTAAVVFRAWGTTADDTLIAKKQSTAAGTTGYALEMSASSATTGRLSDGTTQHSPTATTRTAGALTMLSLVKSGSTVTAYNGSTAGTPVTVTASGTFANSDVFRIGRLSGAGTNYLDAGVMAVMVWRRALSATELAAVATYYGVA